MANQNIEIEIKLPLHNKEEVTEFLNKNAKIKAKKVRQKDTYFTPAHKDFLDAKHPYQFLRVRESKKGAFFAYKHCHPENSNHVDYLDEYETNIGDSKSLMKILNSLDFKEILFIDKTRSIWEFDDVEIAIDEVKDYGVFIELELKSHHDNPKKAKKYLYSMLNKLNAKVGKEDQDGYAFGILKKQGYKFGN